MGVAFLLGHGKSDSPNRKPFSLLYDIDVRRFMVLIEELVSGSLNTSGSHTLTWFIEIGVGDGFTMAYYIF